MFSFYNFIIVLKSAIAFSTQECYIVIAQFSANWCNGSPVSLTRKINNHRGVIYMAKLVVRNSLALYRRAAGLTQSELAKRAAVSQNCISAIECGVWMPSLKVALSICAVLSVSVDAIFWLA